MERSPRRDLDGRTLVSDQMPAVEIDVRAEFAHVGRLQFNLYGAAQVESFVYMAEHDRRGGRLLVIQFEGYLDDNTHTYDYSFAETIALGNRPFHTDRAVVDLVPAPPADSDIGRVLRLVEAQGYALPARAIVQRFVYLPDRAKRNELLIFYAEPFGDGAPDTTAWHTATQRAMTSFTVRFPSSHSP